MSGFCVYYGYYNCITAMPSPHLQLPTIGMWQREKQNDWWTPSSGCATLSSNIEITLHLIFARGQKLGHFSTTSLPFMFVGCLTALKSSLTSTITFVGVFVRRCWRSWPTVQQTAFTKWLMTQLICDTDLTIQKHLYNYVTSFCQPIFFQLLNGQIILPCQITINVMWPR